MSVETATDRRSVAVMRGARVLALRASDLREGGASSALLEIDGALREASVSLRDFELFAVAAGPGSFTGLRSGLATMKALAVTLSKPLVGVPTLHAVAYAARPGARVLAMLPAGRGEVFAQLLGVDEDGVVEFKHDGFLDAPRHVLPSLLLERMERAGGGLKWAGGGAIKYLDLIEEAGARAGVRVRRSGEGADEAAADEWLVASSSDTLAVSVGLLAQSRYARGDAASAEELQAIYVRPSDAELKEQCHAPGQ